MLNVCTLFLFSSEDFYTDLFTLMEKILGCSRVWNWELFTDLFTSSCVMISSPSEHGSPEGKGHLSLYSFFLPCSRVFEIKNKSQVYRTGDIRDRFNPNPLDRNSMTILLESYSGGRVHLPVTYHLTRNTATWEGTQSSR